eukprot:TRINITY_DN9018_c0_g1_i1.p1 TRINITY_DN9018_c0_g1~~TRINITY_DN9018_c0_g1_i1.p1  ORF type:complete len:633 (+),score=99.41 TRINITY_DN9018_c0_g1_i1:47-1945(+)
MQEATALQYDLEKEKEKAAEIEDLLRKLREDVEADVERTLFVDPPSRPSVRRLSPRPTPPGPRLRSPPGARDSLQVPQYTQPDSSYSPSPRRGTLPVESVPLSSPPKVSPSPPLSPSITASAVRRAAPYTAQPRLSPIAPVYDLTDDTLPQPDEYPNDDDDAAPRGLSPLPITMTDKRLVSPTKTPPGRTPPSESPNRVINTPPRKVQIQAAAELQQQPNPDGKFNVEDALLPLRSLGPFYASLFDEILQSSDIVTKAANRYTSMVAAINDEYCHNLKEILRSMNVLPAKEDFIGTACDEKVQQVLDGGAPATSLRVAIQGPHASGLDELLFSASNAITTRYCFPRERSSVSLLPLDWTQVLPPYHKHIELGTLYCNYVQHVISFFCVLNPTIRSKSAAYCSYWKKLATQLHQPAVPDTFEKEINCFWRDLGKKIQQAFHKRRSAEFLKMMLLLPKVMGETVGKRDVVFLYRNLDVLGDGKCSFCMEGKPIPDQNILLSSVLASIDSSSCGVVALLDADSSVRLVDWLVVTTEGVVKPSHLQHISKPASINLINQTAGCPAYVSKLLSASSRLATARNCPGSEALNKKRKQLEYLRQCATTVMTKISELIEEIPRQEEEEAFPDSRLTISAD